MDLSAIALTGLDRGQTNLEQTASRLARVGTVASDGGARVDTVDLTAAMVDLLATGRISRQREGASDGRSDRAARAGILA